MMSGFKISQDSTLIINKSNYDRTKKQSQEPKIYVDDILKLKKFHQTLPTV